ncbi:MAG: hypothetical protein EOP90_07110 [Lysobacteraceae bacterium]|nr:MAG: hypothetical protein EOP90_07110 [Xanthomonadaceae bacterium]
MFHARFRSIRPRHPLARLLLGLVGVVVALILVAVGVFAAAALAIGGALLLLARSLRTRAPATPRARPATVAGVIEGEFSVVDGPGTPVRMKSPQF